MDNGSLLAILVLIISLISYTIVYCIHVNRRTFTLVIDNNIYAMTFDKLALATADAILIVNKIEIKNSLFEVSFNRGATWVKHKMGVDPIRIGSDAAYMILTPDGELSIVRNSTEVPLSDYSRIPPQILLRWNISNNSGLLNIDWYSYDGEKNIDNFTYTKSDNDVECIVKVNFSKT